MVPVAAIVAANGFMRAPAIGLSLMGAGCIALVGGLMAEQYPVILAALLAVSTGATFLQIAGNTAATIVGDSQHAATRLNLLQGFNSLGTVAGPALGATTIVSTCTRSTINVSLPSKPERSRCAVAKAAAIAAGSPTGTSIP